MLIISTILQEVLTGLVCVSVSLPLHAAAVKNKIKDPCKSYSHFPSFVNSRKWRINLVTRAMHNGNIRPQLVDMTRSMVSKFLQKSNIFEKSEARMLRETLCSTRIEARSVKIVHAEECPLL